MTILSVSCISAREVECTCTLMHVHTLEGEPMHRDEAVNSEKPGSDVHMDVPEDCAVRAHSFSSSHSI